MINTAHQACACCGCMGIYTFSRSPRQVPRYWPRGKVGMVTMNDRCMLQSTLTHALCIPSSAVSTRRADQQRALACAGRHTQLCMAQCQPVQWTCTSTPCISTPAHSLILVAGCVTLVQTPFAACLELEQRSHILV